MTITSSTPLPPSSLFRILNLPASDTPFSEDLFGRKKEAEYIYSLTRDFERSAVIAIDAPFGFGKTYFVREFSEMLRKSGEKVVTFNAWTHDTSPDPYVSFSNAILDEIETKSDETLKNAKKIAGLSGKVLGTVGMGILARFVIGDDASASLKSIGLSEEDLAKVAEEAGSEAFLRFKLEEKYKAAFQDSLSKSIAKTKSKKIFVFIDELDRCRPDFALELLENIKHLFSVPGAIFLVAVNTEQLSKLVDVRHGTANEGSSYLRRFFDWTYKLKPPKRLQQIKSAYKELNLTTCFSQGVGDSFPYGVKLSQEILALYCSAKKLSARDINQICVSLRLEFPKLSSQEARFTAFDPMLEGVKIIQPDLYASLRGFKTSPLSSDVPRAVDLIKQIASVSPRTAGVTVFRQGLVEAYLCAAFATYYQGNGKEFRALPFKIDSFENSEEIEGYLLKLNTNWGEPFCGLDEHFIN